MASKGDGCTRCGLWRQADEVEVLLVSLFGCMVLPGRSLASPASVASSVTTEEAGPGLPLDLTPVGVLCGSCR